MPTFIVTTFDGTEYEVNLPEGGTEQEAEAQLREHLMQQSAPSDYSFLEPEPTPPPQAGFFGSLTEEATKPLRTAIPAAEYAATGSKESAEALAKAAESKYATSEFVSPTSMEAIGQDVTALKQQLGSSIGSMLAPMATGAVTENPFAAGAVLSAQHGLDNLIRQAQEGKTGEEVSAGKAFGAGVVQGGLDMAEFQMLANVASKVPGLRNLVLGSAEETATEAKSLVSAIKNKTAKVEGDVVKYPSLVSQIGTTTLQTAATEVPIEVAQQVLERWQSGLPLDDDQAKDEYTQAAAGAAALSGVFGPLGGAVEYTAKRSEARAKEAAAKAAEEEVKTPETTAAKAVPPTLATQPDLFPKELQAAEAAKSVTPTEEEAVVPTPSGTQLDLFPEEAATAKAATEAQTAGQMDLFAPEAAAPETEVSEGAAPKQYKLPLVRAIPSEERGAIQNVHRQAKEDIARHTEAKKRADLVKDTPEYSPLIDMIVEGGGRKQITARAQEYYKDALELKYLSKKDIQVSLTKALQAYTSGGKDVTGKPAGKTVSGTGGRGPSVSVSDEGTRGPKVEGSRVSGVETTGEVTEGPTKGKAKQPPPLEISAVRSNDINDRVLEGVSQGLSDTQILSNIKEYDPKATTAYVKDAKLLLQDDGKLDADNKVTDSGRAYVIGKTIKPTDDTETKVLKTLLHGGNRAQATKVVGNAQETNKTFKNLQATNKAKMLEGGAWKVLDAGRAHIDAAKTKEATATKPGVTTGSAQATFKGAKQADPLYAALEQSQAELKKVQDTITPTKKKMIDLKDKIDTKKELGERVTEKETKDLDAFKKEIANHTKSLEPYKAKVDEAQKAINERAKKEYEGAPVKEEPKVEAPKIEVKKKAPKKEKPIVAKEAPKEEVKEEPKVEAKEEPKEEPKVSNEKVGVNQEHPEWATGHAEDLNGVVVYSDDKHALVMGNTKGQPFYAHVGVDKETGNRTAVDIANYTGKLFTPDEKAKLVKIAQKFRDEEVANENEHPMGPFEGAKSNVVSTDSIDTKYTQFLTSLMDKLGLSGVKVFLYHPEDLVQPTNKNAKSTHNLYNSYHKVFGSVPSLMRDTNGLAGDFGPGFSYYYIGLKSGRSKEQTIETLAHELGHIIQLTAYKNAPEDVKAEIKAAHDAWLAKTKNMTPAQLVRSLRNRFAVEGVVKTWGPAAYDITTTAGLDPYWTSFEEWFADNVSRWATTDEKPLSLIDKFFSDVGKMMRFMLDAVRKMLPGYEDYSPDQAMKKFLDSMTKESPIDFSTADKPTVGSDFAMRGAEGPLSDEAVEVISHANTPNPDERQAVGWYQEMLKNAYTKYGSSPTAAKTISVMSNMPSHIYSYWVKALSMYNLSRIYGKIAPSINTLLDHFTMMARAKNAMLLDYEKDKQRFNAVLRDLPLSIRDAQRSKFNSFVNSLGMSQARIFERAKDSNTYTEKAEVKKLVDDVSSGKIAYESLTPTSKQLYNVGKLYYELNPQVRAMARDVLSTYRKLGDTGYNSAIKRILSNITDKETQKRLRGEIENSRLEYYTPFVRDGKYRLSYYNANDEQVVLQFASEAERQSAWDRLSAIRGNKTFVASVLKEFDKRDNIAPVGLFNDVVEAIKDSRKLTPEKAKDMSDVEVKEYHAKTKELVDSVFDTFIDFMPNSIKAEAKGRKVTTREEGELKGLNIYGVEGFNQDVLQVFEDRVPNLIFQINNYEWVDRLDTAYGEIDKELGKASVSKDASISKGQKEIIMQNMKDRVKFARRPTYSKLTNLLATANYYNSIAGNISSALVNTTVLPMMVFPKLNAKYGYARTGEGMGTATRVYAAFRRYDRSDRSEEALKVFRRELAASNLKEFNTSAEDIVNFYNYLLERNAVGNTAMQDLKLEKTVGGYEEMSQKVNAALGVTFRETEQFNRGVTFLSSFLLEMDKTKGDFKKASLEANIFNGELNGSNLHEAGSSLFQSNLGRSLLTFRIFPMNMMIQTGLSMKNMFKKFNFNEQEREMAVKEVVGIYGMAFMFAGVRGMPLFGLAEFLASMFLSDDDEPKDLTQMIYEALGAVGGDGIVSSMFNVDMANRTGFNGLLWRDDPKRLADVGYLDYAFEKALGPTYGIYDNFRRGMEHMAEGRYERGIEAMSPAAIRNGLKGLRYAMEGAQTKDGDLIKDVSGWNSALQALGFSPYDISLQMSQNAAQYGIKTKLANRKSALLTKLWGYYAAGDMEGYEETVQELREFQRKNPSLVSSDTISKSVKQRISNSKNTINGVYMSKKDALATRQYMADLEEEEPEAEEEEE